MEETSFGWVWDRLQKLHRGETAEGSDSPVDALRLGEAALRLGWISDDRLALAFEEQERLRGQGGSAELGQVLLRRRDITATQLAELLRLVQKEPVRATPEPSLQRFGRYQLQAEIGRGGMGRVYRAYDPWLKRFVALKILDGTSGSSRLQREAQAAARLTHPDIVTLFDVGSEEGQHYLAMELVEGELLEKTWGSWDMRRKITALEAVARAIGYAHSKGVIHRDIKPGNVMVTQEGQVKVMDLGLARVEGESKITLTGTVMGTPAYMAPEQVRGDAVGAEADVYALGVMLYEAVTGRVPFEGTQVHEVYQKILTQEPERPRKTTARIPLELEVVCLKAMEKEPARRYGTAEDLAEDLRRWLSGEPIRARRASISTRAARWVKRRRMPLITAAAVSIAMLVGGVVALRTYAHRLIDRAELQVIEGEQAPAGPGVMAEVAASVDRALLILPGDARAHSLLGRILVHRGDTAPAVAEFTRAIDASEKSRGHNYYLRGLARGSDLQAAREDFQRALEHGLPSEEERLHAQASLALAEGRPDDAETICRDLLRARTSSPNETLRRLECRLWETIGQCRVGQGRTPEAEPYFARVQEIRRGDVEAWRSRGEGLWQAFYEMWAHPERPHSVEDWAPGSPLLNLLEEAILEFTRFIERRPRDHDGLRLRYQAYQLRARAATRIGHDPRPFLEASIEDARRRVEFCGEDTDPYNHMGVCYQYIYEYHGQYGGDLLGPLSQAIQAFRDAIRLDKTNADAGILLGSNLVKRAGLPGQDAESRERDYREAVGAFTGAIEYGRPEIERASGHYQRGAVLYQHLGEGDRALLDFREAIRLNPQYRNMLTPELRRRVAQLDDMEYQ